MPITMAQLDPKTALDAINSAASSGNAAQLLSLAVVGLIGVVGIMAKALMSAKDAILAGEKEHSKKVEELLKGSSNVLAEILAQIRSAGGR